MEFTKDIKFGRKPMNSKYLKLTYSGTLFKKNSSDVSIVYGFGEDWEKTNEQKMQKLPVGFRAHVLMENYDTFNFCFKNSNNEWDNNNGFNYITPIEKLKTNSNANSFSPNETKESNLEVAQAVNNSQDVPTEETSIEELKENNTNSDVLDALVQELFEEYNSKFVQNSENLSNSNTENIEKNVETVSTGSDTNNVGAISTGNDTSNAETISTGDDAKNIEVFNKLDSLLDDILQQIETKESELKEETSYSPIDIGKELDNLFIKAFSESNKQEIEHSTNEVYVPQFSSDDIFEEKEKPAEISSTSSDIINNNSKIEATGSNNIKSEIENDIFDFENLDFDFEMNSKTISVDNNYRKFSDSFYDDEDISIHDSFSNIQEIVNETVENLNKEVTFDEEVSENFENNFNEYDKIVAEYAEYFDNLIEEIVSSPTSYLSTPVSNEQVFESEKTELSISEPQNLQVENTKASENVDGATGVPKEYALYDYKAHGFFYTLMRRCKLLLSTVFNKIPKLFGKQTENDEQ